MPRYDFAKVTLKAARQRDGKRQQRTFWQTINPFNRREDGQPKTRDDIMAELRTEATAWQEAP